MYNAEGLADCDTLDPTAFATVTAVAEGEVDNVMTYSITGVAIDGDYEATETWGKLSVAAAEPPPPEDEDDDDDPPGYDPDDPQPPTPPQGEEGEITGFSDYDCVTVYDGEAHTLDTEALQSVIDAQTAADDWKGDTPITVTYSLTGEDGTWTDTPPEFTDVVSTGFWYKVSAPDFKDSVHAVGVTINNRPSAITFTAADKVYDGNTDAVCSGAEFDNLVEGESFTLDTAAMTFAFESAAVGSGKTVTATATPMT